MCQVHNDQMKRTAGFSLIISQLQAGTSVDLSTESLYSLHDMEFQAELSGCLLAQEAILTEIDKRQ